MKKILFVSVLAAAAAAACAAQYEIDPFHTNARFEIDHFGTSSNVGGVYEVSGKVTFDAAKKNRLGGSRDAARQPAIEQRGVHQTSEIGRPV